MKCYKDGGCGAYEMYSCNECPASKESYACKGCKHYSVCVDYSKNGSTIGCPHFSALDKTITKFIPNARW